MNPELSRALAELGSDRGQDAESVIAEWLDCLQARGLLRASTNAVLLGEEYHLGGAEDTRRMAEALHLTADDRVLDLACYVGGPARHVARGYGCHVVGVDFSEDAIAVARTFTRLSGLEDRVTFHCADAEAVPEPDGSFSVAWSQCSFPADLHWLSEVRRLLAPGGRVAFTGLIRRSLASEQGLLSLEEAAERVRGFGFRVTGVEDISELDLTYGWVPSMEKLRCREQHYRTRFGEAWVQKAYAELQIDIESWRSGREGNGRIVAVKE
jgi:SAM-dependent methyltransferase